MKPVKCEAIKGCCEDEHSLKQLRRSLRWLVSLMIHWQLAALSSTFHTWLPSRGLQKKKKVTLQRVHQLYCCGTMKTSSPEIRRDAGSFFVLPPNQTQLAGKCSTKTLLEVSHQLRYDFYLRTAQCVHTWDVFRDDVPWDRATLRTFPADRMGSVKPDLNRLWLRGLVQH